MIKGIKIKDNKKDIDENIIIYKRPEYVYIPLVVYEKTDCECLVNIGDKVLKGSVIGRRNDQFEIPIHSTISGTVIGIEEKYYLNGMQVKCVKIENDFIEKQDNLRGAKYYITSYSKEDFISLLKNCAVIGMGGSGFPTYLKYQKELNTIIVNAVECEPFINSDYQTALMYTEDILEGIDAIMEINNLEQGIIAINENNKEIKDKFEHYLGTYPKIKISMVKDIYPMGWERMLIQNVLNITYDKLPSEAGIVVNNINTIYAIYIALKYRRPLSSRIITVTGDGIEEAKNIRVKIGSSMKDIIKQYFPYKEADKVLFVAGGPMMGNCIATDDLIVTKSLNGILITNDTDEEVLPCIRCGRCITVCPVNINPIIIKDNVNDYNMLKDLHPEKCIECGLCSYICPSKIKIRERVRQAKKEIRRH